MKSVSARILGTTRFDLKGGKAISGDKGGIDNQPQGFRVDDLRVCQILHGDRFRFGVKVAGSHEQGVVMGRDIPKHGIAKLNAVLTEAVRRAAVDVVAGGQQIHRRMVAVGITAAAILLNCAFKLHPVFMLLIAPQASVEVLDKQLEAIVQAAVIGESFHERFAVAYHTGLNTLCQPRAAQGGTAHLFHILGTELAAHILRVVFESVDIHGFLLSGIKISGKRKMLVRSSALVALAFFLPCVQ